MSGGLRDRRANPLALVPAGEEAPAPVIDVPAVVCEKARALGADAWLDDLPSLVRALEDDWGLEAGRAFGDATEAYVVEASLVDGTPAVLKLLVPRAADAAKHEITVLRLADGEGCVRLLRSDEARGALLLERLGPSMRELGLPFERRLDPLCGTAARLWRPAPGAGLPTGAEKGRWLVDHITSLWEALDHPCRERAVDHAVGCAERRIAAHDDERSVLVHGDVHQWNALRADGDGEAGFKLVDPDGLLAEPAYDLGILMREDPVELLAGDPRERARHLAARTGLDAEAIWEWGVVERVSTGLLGVQVGLEPVATEMLRAADVVAAAG
jgi:streptomycin 6-kinase